MTCRDLPRPGTVEYFGYTFPPQFFAKIRGVMEYDDADRMVKYTRYTLQIETIILPDDAPQSTPSDPISDNLENIRTKLTTPGKTLKFTGQGFGDLEINDGSPYSLDYGPKPRMLSWEPVGSNRAVRIVWEVEFTVAECAGARNQGIGALTWEVDYEIDQYGMTRRTISGVLEIASTFSRQDTADNYRERINVPRIPGFKREEMYGLTSDKRSLKFRITDVEINSDSPYPDGVTDIEFDHSIESSLLGSASSFDGVGFRSWNAQIGATIRLAPGVPAQRAWFIFLVLLRHRTQKLQLNPSSINQVSTGQKVTIKGAWIPTRISIKEICFRREFRFRVDYYILSSLDKILEEHSGMFRRLPGDWNTWSASLAYLNRRGYAKLKTLAQEDITVDFCTSNPTLNIVNARQGDSTAGKYSMFSVECPPLEGSWIDYKNTFQVTAAPNTVVHRRQTNYSLTNLIAKAVTPSLTAVGTYFPLGSTNSGSSSGGGSPDSTANSHTVQVRGPTEYRLRMRGYALRFCYRITPPTISNIGGKPPISTGQSKINTTVWKNLGKCPIFLTTWDQEFVFTGDPQGDLADQISTDGIPDYYRP